MYRGFDDEWPADDDLDEDDAGLSIDELVRENHPALQELLAEAVNDPRRETRTRAALRLAELFQDVRAVPSLAEALDDHRRQVRKSASEALWEIGDTDTAGLIALLYESYGHTRDVIASALARIGWQADDPDSDALYLIACRDWRGCVQMGGKAVPRLINALGDHDGAVRRAAAWALGEIGDPAAVEPVACLLGDTEGGMFGVGDRVCDVAADALRRIGTGEAIEALRMWGFEG